MRYTATVYESRSSLSPTRQDFASRRKARAWIVRAVEALYRDEASAILYRDDRGPVEAWDNVAGRAVRREV